MGGGRIKFKSNSVYFVFLVLKIPPACVLIIVSCFCVIFTISFALKLFVNQDLMPENTSVGSKFFPMRGTAVLGVILLKLKMYVSSTSMPEKSQK